jgi:hypothetical protein
MIHCFDGRATILIYPKGLLSEGRLITPGSEFHIYYDGTLVSFN